MAGRARPPQARALHSRDARIAELLGLLGAASERGYIGEPVSQLEHALQSADLATRAGEPPAAVLAALLHDVGHLCAGPDAAEMEDLGIVDHEDVGARYLAALGFGPAVTDLVRGHVQAKRYLAASRSRYAARLSAASRRTLELQGGPMDDAERAAFEDEPGHRAALRLRGFDDAAKVPGRCVPGLDAYVSLLEEQLRAGS